MCKQNPVDRHQAVSTDIQAQCKVLAESAGSRIQCMMELWYTPAQCTIRFRSRGPCKVKAESADSRIQCMVVWACSLAQCTSRLDSLGQCTCRSVDCSYSVAGMVQEVWQEPSEVWE